MRRVKTVYEELPLWMKPGVKEWNKTSVEFDNGSRIFCSATSASAIRGSSVNYLILDEFAFVPNGIASDFYQAVYPVISSGKTTKITIISTPNGMNLFAKFWFDAKEGRSNFKPYQALWNQVPGRDDAWRQETIANLPNPEAWETEYECQFLGSANTLISNSTIKNMFWNDPIYSKDSLDIYEEPKKDHIYIIPVDTSEGTGRDNSAFHIIDITEYPHKQVAKYYNNEIPYMVYPTIVHEVAKKYNEAFVICEVNNIGSTVAEILYADLEYENILQVSNRGRGGQVLGEGFGKGSNKLGVTMTKSSKPIGCRVLKSLLEEAKLQLCDFDTISELQSFIAKGGSYQADEGCHDDLAMGLVIYAWVTAQEYFKELADGDLRRDVYSKQIQMVEDDLLPDGFFMHGLNQDERVIESDGTVWKKTEDYSIQRW